MIRPGLSTLAAARVDTTPAGTAGLIAAGRRFADATNP